MSGSKTLHTTYSKLTSKAGFIATGSTVVSLCSLAVLTLLVATACGGGGGGSTANPLPDSNTALLGTWEGPGCEIGPGTSRNNFYRFNTDGTAQLTFRNFSQANCSELAYTDSAFARFTEGQVSTLADGREITQLDFDRIAGRTITPVSTEAALTLNMSAACGLSDWQVDIPRQVQSCQIGLLEVDAQLLDVVQIYHITDDYFLYFGNELIFSADQRPTQLTTIPSHVRQLDLAEGFPPDVLGFWQISGTSFFYELRPNSIIVEYLPSQVRTDCYDVFASATRALGNDEYGAPGTSSISITPSQSGITFITPSGTTRLEPAADVQPTDLIPCASLAGG